MSAITKQVAALNSLAGSGETLVQELSLKGKRLDLVARSEGSVVSADGEIWKALAPP